MTVAASTQLTLDLTAPSPTPAPAASSASWAARSIQHRRGSRNDPTICLDCNRGDRTTAKPFCPVLPGAPLRQPQRLRRQPHMSTVPTHDTTLGAGTAMADALAADGHALIRLEPGNATTYRLTAVWGAAAGDPPCVYLGLVGHGCYLFDLRPDTTADPSYVADKLKCTWGDGDVLADVLAACAERTAELHRTAAYLGAIK